MDTKYSLYLFHARVCFWLVLLTTAPCTAALAADRSVKRIFLLEDLELLNQMVPGMEQEI